MTTPTPTPDHHQPDPARRHRRDHTDTDHTDTDHTDTGHTPPCGRNPGRAQGQHRPDAQDRRHGVGLTDTQRAALTELINSAPLPPAHILDRLRGYLPPAPPP